MPLLRDIRFWFFPKKRFRRPPNTIISPYLMMEANEQQRLLMRAGVARSPQDATALMRHYRVKTAQEVIDKIPPRRSRGVFYRFILLIRRIEGHDTRDLYKRSGNEDKVQVKYKVRRE